MRTYLRLVVFLMLGLARLERLCWLYWLLVHPIKNSTLRSHRSMRKGERMAGWEESATWTRDAVLGRECAPECACKILTCVRVGERGGPERCRVLCHQFSTSSLPRPGNCISRSNAFWREMNFFKVGTLLFSSAGDQGRNSRTTVFQLPSGRQSCSV